MNWLQGRLELKATRHCTTLFILVTLWLPAAWAQSEGSSPSNPALPGTTVSGIVECGEGYTSHELYDMKITLLELIRGEEAWNRVREADPANVAAPEGKEYVLVRVKYEYYARGVPGLCVHPLKPDQFTAYSAGGEGYDTVSVVTPKPELRKELKSGESAEGWIVFAVATNDKAPLIHYSADTGGAVQHGGGKWFRLQ
jgi:hypothetical protein